MPERWAAGAVAVMTAPAFLAFPALGVWYVAKVWPAMGGVDRALFVGALAVFCVGLPFGFRRGMERAKRVGDPDLSPLETALLALPLLMGGWALTHQVAALLWMSVWFAWDMGKVFKRRKAAALPTASRAAPRGDRR